jgi:hypothetical protein
MVGVDEIVRRIGKGTTGEMNFGVTDVSSGIIVHRKIALDNSAHGFARQPGRSKCNLCERTFVNSMN